MKFVRINRKWLCAVIVLLFGSAICVAVSALIFSDIGAQALFKLGIIIKSEAVDPGDSVYLEYFDVKRYINETTGFRVFIGGNYEGGYAAALDFLKFAKQNTDITTIRLDAGNSNILNEYLESGYTSLLADSDLGEAAIAFVIELYDYNQKLPPQKRVQFDCGGECGGSEFMPTERNYDRALKASGIIDVNCIYPGTEDCEPFFDVSLRDLRFGSLNKLEWFTRRLYAVSGNFGKPEFTGHNQPEFYFLISDRLGSD